MRNSIFLFLFALVIPVFSFAENSSASSNETIALMKPHDHTGKALDIMVKKDVTRENYGKKLYRKHCALCHGMGRMKVSQAPLNQVSLRRYATISALYPVILQGCAKRGGSRFDTLGSVKAIFIARYIKTPAK